MEMRGVAVTPGYWQRDVLTGEPFTKDGRLRTGDVAPRRGRLRSLLDI
jgi:long-subunit acyl-CoA synthetase (AMP-forming)